MDFINQKLNPILDLLVNIGTLFSFCVGLYLYFSQKDKISQLFQVLISLKNHDSYRDLHKKLDELERLNFDRKEQKSSVEVVLASILGQLRQNEHLKSATDEIVPRIESFVNDPVTFSNKEKSLLISELREFLRNRHFENIGGIVHEKK